MSGSGKRTVSDVLGRNEGCAWSGGRGSGWSDTGSAEGSGGNKSGKRAARSSSCLSVVMTRFSSLKPTLRFDLRTAGLLALKTRAAKEMCV